MKKSALFSLLALLFTLQFNQDQKNIKEDSHPLDSINIDGLKWRSIGPSLISGRITDIAVNPNKPRDNYVTLLS